MTPAEIRSELSEWSTTLLRMLAEEENCSEAFREVAAGVLRDRGIAGDEMLTLTRENLSALFNENAPNAPQVRLLGMQWPIKSGWMARLIGTEIAESLYASLLALKGRKPRGVPKKEWRTATRRPSAVACG